MRGEVSVRLVVSLIIVVIAAGASGQQLERPQQTRDREPSLNAVRKLADEIRSATFHRGQFYLVSRLELADIGIEQQFFTPVAGSGSVSLGFSAPQKLFWVPAKKFVMSGELVPSYSYVGRGHDTQWGLRGRGDVHFLLNHLYLDFYAANANELVADTGEIGQLLTVRRPAYGLASELRYSSKTWATLETEKSRTRFPRDRHQPEGFDVQLLERNDWNNRLVLSHRTLPRTTFNLIGEYRDSNFVNEPRRSATRKYTALGAEWQGRRTAITAEAGPATLNVSRAGGKDFRGALGNLRATKALGERWRIDGAARRDVIFSLDANNDYYVSDRVSGRAEVDVTRKFSIDFGSTVGRDHYDVPVNGILREDHTEFDSVGWLYRLEHVQGGFEVGYFRRDSNVAVESDDGIRLFLRLSLHP